MRFIFTIMFLLSAAIIMAQGDSIYNAGFEYWRGGYFSPLDTSGRDKCCGLALAEPTGWGIPEELMAMPTNHFVYKEESSSYIHSGNFSARLYTNTTTEDSAGNTAGGVAVTSVLVPGTITCAGIVGYGGLGLTGDLTKTIAYSLGEAFADTPTALNFYMMLNHDATDTAMYAYAFTRWDSIAQKEDTLAANAVDIPDANLPMLQWLYFSDPIHYTMPGLPDTLHLIFYGGRNADSTKAGNTTWLDDVSFTYGGVNAGIRHLSSDDAVSVYPNPGSSVLQVKADQYMAGYVFELYDLRGSLVMQEKLSGTESSYPVTALPDGIYLYRLLDGNAAQVTSGKVTVAK